MAVATLESSFDAAFWFVDRAMENGEYVQPQKLQRLLYLAQAYYAAAYEEQLLMPAIFVAEALGPVEPSTFRLFGSAIPQFDRKRQPKIADQFLDAIWRRFGHHSAEHLNRLISTHDPYREAMAKGERTIIVIKAMAQFYGKKETTQMAGIPSLENLVPPRIVRSHTGQAVEVKKWTPGKKE